MPSGPVLVAAVLVAVVWLAGSAVVDGAKKLGHGVKVGVTRLVHPHRHNAPAPEREVE